jgi:CheY-like chemotaxis protein/signal transduction histidine kinase
MRTEELLKQSQALAEELQKTNAELEVKAHLLAEQKTEVEAKNREVEQAKAALEEKAEQLALTSKYKSEFLANMSHELRTPLNNLLILAKMLSENSERNLTGKQVKFAETIHTSGTDLLALINDILDLSKIESGKMDVEVGAARFAELEDYCFRTFRHVAEGKGLDFTIETDPLLSDSILTDVKRLQQVLKNLLSNALKFTGQGSVQLSMRKATSGWSAGNSVLARARNVVAFTVTDTGIGIPLDKQKIIFEAFQQADGTTSRKYGGTGLGLSISRELARLLGGEIRLTSQPEVGSAFTLYLPQTYSSAAMVKPETPELTESTLQQAVLETNDLIYASQITKSAAAALVEEIAIDDDRKNVQPGEPVLLIVEDDPTFAKILVEMAHAQDLKALVALRGNTALALATEFRPSSITLDIGLPDMAGWTILDRLKHDTRTASIPVHVISGDDQRGRSMALGAMTYVQKATGRDDLPGVFGLIRSATEPRIRKLMVVSSDHSFRESVAATVGGPGVQLIEYQSGATFLDIIGKDYFDAVVFDFALRDVPVVRLIGELQNRISPFTPPAIVAGPREIEQIQLAAIARLAVNSAVRYVSSMDSLLEETIWLMHRPESDLLDTQKTRLQKVREHDAVLMGKTVLVVDDDLRNIFALTSLLEHHEIKVLHAENGRAGIDLLQKHPVVDAVLMDIMMPEMDGYETIAAIRRIPSFHDLPIVALTAKAMKGDREKCIQAGASDYVTKPVELEQLFSVLRVLISARGDALMAQKRDPAESGAAEGHSLADLVEDDRHRIQPGDAILLVVEDDPVFARILVEMAHERGLKALVAVQGKAAIAIAREFNPAAVTLDISLPDMAGWSLLDRFKHDPMTRHIPVHIISGDDDRRRGLALGAMTYIQKASDQGKLTNTFGLISEAARIRTRKILLISSPQSPIPEAVSASDVEITQVATEEEALQITGGQYLDGVIIETPVAGVRVGHLIADIHASVMPYAPPVIIFTPEGHAGPSLQEVRLMTSSSAVRFANTLPRLLDETVVLLHRHEGHLSDSQREMLVEARTVDPSLVGARVLVVDDDIRNIFALSSVLQHHQINVLHASNGRDCLRILETEPDIDIILMDIMMPEMDGYETMQAIRADSRVASIPIVALTAKAMKGDREKCLDSGATDYVAKPVDLDQLFSVLRVCLDNRTRRTETPARSKRRKPTARKGARNADLK